jgi:hypothetical protein
LEQLIVRGWSNDPGDRPGFKEIESSLGALAARMEADQARMEAEQVCQYERDRGGGGGGMKGM